MMNLLKIFIDQYEIYLQDELVTQTDETEQAIIYGKLQGLEHVRNMIQALEDEE